MAEVVDSIIADLQVRYQQYVAGYDKAIAKHKEFIATVPKIDGAALDIAGKSAETYANRHKKASNDIGDAAERATAKVKRTVKDRSDATIAAERKQTDAAKAAAAERVRAAEAEDARYAALAERAAARAAKGVPKGRSSGFSFQSVADAENKLLASVSLAEQQAAQRYLDAAKGGARGVGATVARTGSGQAGFGDTGATSEVAAEKEINFALRDRIDLSARLLAADGAEKNILKDQITYLRLIDQYKRANLSETEAAALAEKRVLAIQTERAAAERRAASAKQSPLRQAAGAAAFGYSPGGGALVGLAATAAVAAGAEAVKFATDYGKELKNVSDQLGITTHDLQVYQAAALRAGVSNEQFRSSFSQLATYLGRAQNGDKEASKAFVALGIDIKGVASAGELLPTLIDRISSIKDPAQRAAIETRLFGEEGAKLDSLLSGGNAKVNDLAEALERTGAILSTQQIKDLADTANKLALVKAQLAVDVSQAVANNADSIERLAAAFLHLAEGAIKAADPLNKAAALALVDPARSKSVTEQLGYSFGPSPEDAMKALLSTPQGRSALRAQIAARRAQLEKSGSNSLLENITGGFLSNDARAELDRQEARLNASDPVFKLGRINQGDGVKPGAVNPHLLSTLNAPSGKSSEALAKEAAAREKAFNDELARSEAEYLAARKDLTVGADAQYRLQLDELKAARDRRNADIASEIKQKRIDAANGPALVAANEKAYQEKLAVAALQRQVAAYNAVAAAAEQSLSLQADILHSQLSLAQTASERRKKELEILDNTQRAEQISDVNTIFSPDPNVTDEQRNAASARLTTSGVRRDAAAAEIRKRNQGPGGDYLDSLPTTVDKVGEAFQRAEVRGLTAFDDKLTSTVSKMLHLHGIAGQFLEDLIRIGIERDLIGPIADGLFGKASGGSGGGGGGLGALLSFGASLFGGGVGSTSASVNTASAFNVAAVAGGRAGGGDVVGGRTYLVGEHGPEPVTFGQSGKVYPTGKLRDVTGSGGGTNVYNRFSIDLRGARTDEQTMAQIKAYVDNQDKQYARGVTKEIRRGQPAATARYGKLGTTG